MTLDRHLLPHEFDLLLDEDVGFGVPPLLAHVRDCAQCTAELAAGRAIVGAIEHLPHIPPPPLFAERVMSRVQLFRPWHAAALEIARRLVPRPGPMRTAVAVAAALATLSMTGLAIWAATQADSFLVLLGLFAEYSRRTAAELARTFFGESAGAALAAGSGATSIIVLAALLGSIALAVALIAKSARAVRARSEP